MDASNLGDRTIPDICHLLSLTHCLDHHSMPTATPRKTTSTTPRKRRSRKATAPKTAVKTVKQTPIKKEVKVVTVKTPVRPTTLLKSSDYINDIKIRFDIHNYEVNALINDIKWSYNQVRDYVVSVYNREFATK